MTTSIANAAEIGIRTELKCGDLGHIVALHGTVYAPEDGFGPRFEAYVARTVAEYVLDNRSSGRIWLADYQDSLVGCAAVADRPGNIGQLRWVLVDERVRGLGLGRSLVTRALDYCVSRNFDSVHLETTDGLPVSMQMYQRLGFQTTSREVVDLWDGPRTLIKMQKSLRAEAPGREVPR